MNTFNASDNNADDNADHTDSTDRDTHKVTPDEVDHTPSLQPERSRVKQALETHETPTKRRRGWRAQF